MNISISLTMNGAASLWQKDSPSTLLDFIKKGHRLRRWPHVKALVLVLLGRYLYPPILLISCFRRGRLGRSLLAVTHDFDLTTRSPVYNEIV